MSFTRLHTMSDDETSQVRSALRRQGVWYTMVSSRYLEIRSEDERQARALLQQIRTEHAVARPPDASSVQRGRPVAQGLVGTSVVVESMEAMRPYLNGEGITKAVFSKMTLARQIGVLQAQIRRWTQETAWLADVAQKGGTTFSQAGFDLGQMTDGACAVPSDWAAWAQQHGGVTVRWTRKKPEPHAFILTKDHALEMAGRVTLSRDACERLVESLQQQMLTLDDIADPVRALETLLGKLHGYTHFAARNAGIIGTSMPVTISGLDMGIYTVRLDVPSREIIIEGGHFQREAINHPHVYAGRP